MTPWQWQDKINYELMMLDESLSRVEYLDGVSRDDNKKFMGHLHIARSYLIAARRDLAAAGKMAESEMNKDGEK